MLRDAWETLEYIAANVGASLVSPQALGTAGYCGLPITDLCTDLPLAWNNEIT